MLHYLNGTLLPCFKPEYSSEIHDDLCKVALSDELIYFLFLCSPFPLSVLSLSYSIFSRSFLCGCSNFRTQVLQRSQEIMGSPEKTIIETENVIPYQISYKLQCTLFITDFLKFPSHDQQGLFIN